MSLSDFLVPLLRDTLLVVVVAVDASEFVSSSILLPSPVGKKVQSPPIKAIQSNPSTEDQFANIGSNLQGFADYLADWGWARQIFCLAGRVEIFPQKPAQARTFSPGRKNAKSWPGSLFVALRAPFFSTRVQSREDPRTLVPSIFLPGPGLVNKLNNFLIKGLLALLSLPLIRIQQPWLAMLLVFAPLVGAFKVPWRPTLFTVRLEQTSVP
jgi:hypothetical protein